MSCGLWSIKTKADNLIRKNRNLVSRSIAQLPYQARQHDGPALAEAAACEYTHIGTTSS